MDNQLSDTDRQILAIWEDMKPREATALKFIVMDESGTFAGQFTCDIDSHGDRYFLIKQAPKSGKWSLSSNLVTNLEAAEEGLPKTAIKYREEYKETISRSIYRLDLDSSDQDNAGQSEKEIREVSTLPAFDYSPREGIRPNTDEWGKANIMICMNFAIEALLYVINYQAQIFNNGKGSRSVSTEIAWSAVLVLASELDQEMAECIKIVESTIKDLCINKLVEDRLCRKLTNGELELEGEAQEEEKSSEDFEECEMEGLNFPLVTEFSPQRIHRYALNRNEWISDYPSGAVNWQKLVTHSKLLNENKIIGSTSNNNLWLYTTNPKKADLARSTGGGSISGKMQSKTEQSLEQSDQGNPGPLTGQALIHKVKTLGNASPQQLAEACGYKTKTNGTEHIDIESYYTALFEAYRK